jgi:predicted adenylyl cyclase CyaB
MNTFEIEIKSLLGEKKNAEALKQRMCELDPNCQLSGSNKQLNHYFEGGDMEELLKAASLHLANDQIKKLSHIVNEGSSFSVRTRQKDEQVLLVVKASLDEGTSANTVSRLEFEEEVDISLEELDNLLLEAGFKYQAKWSREREEYNYKGVNVCLDKNAGYGYLAEFEKVLEGEDDSAIASARADIEALMAELEVSELPQDRLERMFAHYNQNWPEYYGTDRVFIIE